MSETPGSEARIPEDKDRTFWRHPALVTAAACLWLLMVAGVAYTAIYVIQTRQYNDCQREYNRDVLRVLGERNSAAESDRAAIRLVTQSGVTLVNVLLMPNSTQEQRIAAIQSWRDDHAKAQAQLNDADQTRKANPLPAPRPC